jgi:outer membrane receptor for ferrienterochelin and colicins
MEYYFNDRHILMAGAGYIGESVRTSRYGAPSDRDQQTAYAFFQYEWLPVSRLNVVGGGRFDHNSIYGSQFSPKLSARYEFSKKIALKASVGRGFKAPNFRQLYLNFTNSAAGGYSVLGTEVIEIRLAELESQGQIQEYLVDPESLGSLQAEHSWGLNVGGSVSLGKKITADVNSFYNTIDNLIETQAVAITTSGQSIYSYRNVQRAFTSGLETDLTYKVLEGLRFSLGYQLLYAKDKDVVEQVKDGNVFYRDPHTLVTKRLQPDEYVGLYNRSRHTGNVKIFYNTPRNGLEGSIRVIYRGKYGIGDIRGNIQGEAVPPSDINSNGILDKYDEFIPGYALVNVSIAKRCWQHFRLQVGVDNLFDYTEPVYIPNLPGRLLYASAAFNLSKNKSINHN